MGLAHEHLQSPPSAGTNDTRQPANFTTETSTAFTTRLGQVLQHPSHLCPAVTQDSYISSYPAEAQKADLFLIHFSSFQEAEQQ